MKNWEDVLIAPTASLRTALNCIELAGSRIALVVDSQRHLKGTLSDGDIRRALLNGLDLEDAVSLAMCSTPTCISAGEGRLETLAKIRRLGFFQMPILDTQGVVVGLATLNNLLDQPVRENLVVIMAGGLGLRLQELTQDKPKPMLHVGPRPILESLIRSYADQGFHNFWLAVNYKAEQIERHFGDGSALGVKIQYLREDKPLGTAGALSLLPEEISLPVVVTNADLLIKEDFGSLVDAHVASGADATMAVRDYEMQVPFGVVCAEAGKIVAIQEKPKQWFMVNAGIYVLSPEAIKQVPKNEFFDMPSLFDTLLSLGKNCCCEPIHGYWLDIGRLPDYERANLDFPTVFR